MEENKTPIMSPEMYEHLKWGTDRIIQYYNTEIDRAIRALILFNSGGIVVMATIISSILPQKPPDSFIWAIVVFVLSLIATGIMLLCQVKRSGDYLN